MHITQTVRAAAPHGDRTPSRGDHKMRGARREHVSSLYRRSRLVEVASVAAALWPEPLSLWEASSAALHEWNPRVRGVTAARAAGNAHIEAQRVGQALRAAPRSTSPRHSAAPPRSRSIGTRAGLVEEHRARFRRHGPPSAAGHSGGRRSWPGTARRSQTTASVHRIRHSMAP